MSKILISASKIVKYYGERKILEFEKLNVYEGDRIGIVGVNGAGKTTLLNILSGELLPDEGTVIRETEISYFRQFRERTNTPDVEKCRKMGLTGKLNREKLSGGELTRLGLAEMGGGGVITFADEPTANLDAEGIALCRELLEQCPTLLLISHDRALLNDLCTSIIEVRGGSLYFYPGNYDAFCKQRESAILRQKFEYEQYSTERSRLERAANARAQARSSVRKTPSRMGNSEARLHKREAGERAKKLEKSRKNILTRIEQLEVKEKPRDAEAVRIDFSLTDPPANREIVTGRGVSFSYGDNVIFDNADFTLPRGSKTALIGANGAGKTTLMELIYASAPGIRLAPRAKLGYFRQSLSELDLNRTALENVMASSVQSENTMRAILARLLIKRDDVHKKAGVLSGGERVKLAFAKMYGSDANLLLLDEPTNFLDIAAIEALQHMVEDYEGTVLFVSHDRAFTDACATRLLRIENHKLLTFDGNLTAYENKRREANSRPNSELSLTELRLSEIISRLSSPNCPNKPELEQEYEALLTKLQRLRREAKR